jgi:hypothetical protein
MDGDRNTCRDYLSYLVRLWRVSVAGAPVWRVSLQRPGEAQQQLFASLGELLAFLWAETGTRGEGQTRQAELCEPGPLFDRRLPALSNDSGDPFCAAQ